MNLTPPLRPLTDPQVNLCRDIRRRGKNKVSLNIVLGNA